MACIAISVVWGWSKISSINEQWRSDGQEVLDVLCEKCDYLEEKYCPIQDIEKLNIKIGEINNLTAMSCAITNDNISLSCRTRTKERMAEAITLSQKAQKLLEEYSNQRQELLSLSQKGAGIADYLSASASSEAGKEIQGIRSDAERVRLLIKRLCEQNIVIRLDYKNTMANCNRIINLIDSNINANQDWQQLEKLHDNYIVWDNSAGIAIMRLRELDSDLKETYRDLRNLPLDRENTYGMVQKKLDEELNLVLPVISKGEELYRNSLREIDAEMKSLQMSIQNEFDSIIKLREEHGTYIDTAQIASMKAMLEAFKVFRQNSYDNIEKKCIPVQEGVSRVIHDKNEVGNYLAFFQTIGDETSDEIIVQKCEEGLLRASTLQSTRLELEKSIETMSGYLSDVKSNAKGKNNEASSFLRNIQLSFPDWKNESLNLNKELAEIQIKLENNKIDLKNHKKSFVNYRDNGYHGETTIMRNKCDKILDMINNVEQICNGKVLCSNGKELIELTQRRDNAKKMEESIVQNIQELNRNLEDALRNGKLRKIKYVPYTYSFASSLQQGIRHYEFALDIPSEGWHKIEIKLRKDKRSIYKLSPHTSHKVVIDCNLTTAAYKRSRQWRLNDSTIGWHESIMLEGNFFSGKNELVLDFSFSSESDKGTSISNGVWQFQYEGLFGSGQKDNFFIEFYLDGSLTSIWVCETER